MKFMISRLRFTDVEVYSAAKKSPPVVRQVARMAVMTEAMVNSAATPAIRLASPSVASRSQK